MIRSEPAQEIAPVHRRIAVFGGVYNNYLALAEAIADARRRDVDAIYCLGDLGAFGPHPNRAFPLVIDNGVRVVRGNYDDSIGRGLKDCQCGYTDPRDNEFAALSYAYTFAKTGAKWRPWLAALPDHLHVTLGDKRMLLCHGSPRRMNEFLWESTTSTAFLRRLFREHACDVILATHTGIKWQRVVEADTPAAAGDDSKLFVNVGVLGRPENDGATNVWYTLLEATGGLPRVEFVPVRYDHERLAAEMREERIPGEFIDTILTGWWTTCLEVLPVKERRRGRY